MDRTLFFTMLACSCIASSLHAGGRSSTNYSIPAEGYDSAGAVLNSTNYSVKSASSGMIALLTSVPNPSITNKSGYVGQLYDVQGFSVSANPPSVNETTGTTQLSAAMLLDDLTTLPAVDPKIVSWSIVSGPIASISSAGIATADTVYQNTSATASGSYQNNSGQVNITVLEVNPDDYGSYANDGIDDTWQVQYFGQPPNPLAGPNADADGTGQTNLFKFVAGLNPLDGSRFTLAIQNVNGQPGEKNLIFQPLVTGRNYTVQFVTPLTTSTWQTLTGSTQNDNGVTRTVTDTSASAPKFYRVEISKP
jgi:hypothetical protein